MGISCFYHLLLFLQSATKISITNKQVVKMREENKKLYKANKLEWSDTTSTKHVVAVDLRQVSDIIKPNQVHKYIKFVPIKAPLHGRIIMKNIDYFRMHLLFLQYSSLFLRVNGRRMFEEFRKIF